MTLQNRVTPLGDLVADSARGLVYGNRGCLHDAAGPHPPSLRGETLDRVPARVPRPAESPLQQPGRYTELFFLDEVTALAAGHRPCAECRREDYDRLVAIWRDLAPGPGRSRRDRRPAPRRAARAGFATRERLHRAPIAELPDGAFVLEEGEPWLVLGAALWRWTPSGYVRARAATRSARSARDHAAVASRGAALRLESARAARASIRVRRLVGAFAHGICARATKS